MPDIAFQKLHPEFIMSSSYVKEETNCDSPYCAILQLLSETQYLLLPYQYGPHFMVCHIFTIELLM